TTKLKTKRFADLAAPIKADPTNGAAIAEEVRALEDGLALARLRAERGATQHDVARALDVSQANISRIEHQENPYLSTLRAYVEALGGELEVNAVFPDRTIVLVSGQR